MVWIYLSVCNVRVHVRGMDVCVFVCVTHVLLKESVK
jgi:hypothetical protein